MNIENDTMQTMNPSDLQRYQQYSSGNEGDDSSILQDGVAGDSSSSLNSGISNLVIQGRVPKPDDERKLFVGQLSSDITKDDLFNYFSQFGEIEDITIKYDVPGGRTRGFAFILYDRKESLQQALQSPEHFINNNQIDPKPAHKRPAVTNPVKKIFIGQLPINFPKEDLENYFQQYGPIENIDLPLDREKNCRRPFCFISFNSAKTAEEVLRQQRHIINGVTIEVRPAKPRAHDQGGGGMMAPQSMMSGGGGSYYDGGGNAYGDNIDRWSQGGSSGSYWNSGNNNQNTHSSTQWSQGANGGSASPSSYSNQSSSVYNMYPQQSSSNSSQSYPNYGQQQPNYASSYGQYIPGQGGYGGYQGGYHTHQQDQINASPLSGLGFHQSATSSNSGTSNSNTWNAQQQLQYASAQQQPAQPAYDQQSLYAYYASYAAHMYNQQQQEQPQQTQSGISPMDPSLSSNNGAVTDAEGQVQKQSNSASSAYQPYPQQR